MRVMKAGAAITLALLVGSASAQDRAQLLQIPAHEKRTLDAASLQVARKTGRVALPLPNGTTIRFVPIGQRERHGVQTIRARQGEARLLLTTDGVNAFGFVDTGTSHYRITTVEGQPVLLNAALLAAPTDLLGSLPPDDAIVDPELVERITGTQVQADGESPQDLVYSVVDVAIFLDPALLAIARPQTLRTQAQAYVDFTNEAFIANDIQGELNLVLVEMFGGSFDAFNPFPGFAANASMHARADLFGADLRHFLYLQRSGVPYCGQAYLVGDTGVSGYQCLDVTFAHEIGHNLGAHHDRANAVGNVNLPINTYNYGFVCGGAGTLMSYVGSSRLPHYSDPNLSHGGEACGIPAGQANAAHNGRAIEVMRAQIEGLETPPATYGSVQFASAALVLQEAGPGSDITVTRDGDLTRAASVEVATVNETAEDALDYEPILQRLEFAAGEAAKVVRITPVNDEDFEPEETLRLVLRYPLGLSVAGAPVAVSISSEDLDRGRAEIETADFARWEYQTPAQVVVRRTGTATNPLTINYATADVTAVAGADYQPVSGQMTFAPGERTKTVDIPIINDDAYEISPKYFNFTISGANLGTRRAVAIYIYNEDPNRGRAEFSSATMSVPENVGVANVTIRRIEGAESTLAIQYATVDGAALAGRDYTATSGTYTFAPGETTRVIAVPILDNARFDGVRAFGLSLQGQALGSIVTTAVDIVNEDPDRGVAQFVQAGYEVSEQAGSLVIPVERVGSTQESLTVGYATQDDSARSPRDYQSVSGQLSFAPGERSATIVIPIVDNIYYAAAPQFTVRLTGELTGSPAATSVRILNDDANRGLAQWSTGNVSVSESAASVTLTVQRTEGSESSLEVRYATADGSARAGIDYRAASGALVFAAGETSKTVQIDVINNAQVDAARAFTVALSGDFVGTVATTTVSIQNDDVAPNSGGGGAGSGGDGGGGGGSMGYLLLALALLARRQVTECSRE